MDVVCVGGGPAGLFFAVCARRRVPGLSVRVVERNRPGATSGWGVTYSDRLMDLLHENDPVAAREVRARSVAWHEQEWRLNGSSAYVSHFRSALERSALLEILTRRAVELGAEVEFGQEVDDVSALRGADLVVAADGVGSRVRRQFGEHFGTSTVTGRNRYLWLGTDRVFPRMTFPFERTDAGWIWMHAYPSSRTSSTCVVECPPETWEGLGLDTMPSDQGLRLLAEVFAQPLRGRPLTGRSAHGPGSWQRFQHLTNRTWAHENVVLMGDAAHAAHFTWASGTRLGMTDAAALAESLAAERDLPAALAAYDRRRRERANRTVESARRRSERWEQLDGQLERDALTFVYGKSGRRDEATLRRLRPVYRVGQLGAVRAAGRRARAAYRWYRNRGRWASEDGSPVVRAGDRVRSG
ncbi:FAD-dependent monooxygenase [Modestobacter marinus]|uniref:FAD-dependent monooxygenase n=1 Tax=Modestobacter marinus TaxID=477641 RepID=UPI001C948647|nr:FAD-dependent monooxygenase [Modestobacter marinus]